MTDEKKTDDIRAEVEARVKAEEEARKADAKPEEDPITPEFVRQCFDANRLGDGALFSALNKGQFLCNLTAKDEWYRWTDHYWELDDRNVRFSQGVEAVVAKYNEEVERLNIEIKKATDEDKKDLAAGLKKRRDNIKARVNSLRDVGADKCLTWATRVEDCLGIRGAEFDRNPWLLACGNGVLELRTGKFRKGRPDDCITKSVPHEWKGIDHPAPTWEKFLDDVFESKREMTEFVGRLFGYGMTGVVNEHIFAILYGEGGRNGKGTLIETLQYILGPLAGPIQSEMLLDQRNARNSAGPSPDIMNLFGKRFCFASETEENRRFSAAKIKWLSGGDTLTGRNPHDKYETRFEPTHLLCLLTNYLPHAPAEDLAFWDRMMLIQFNVRFVDNPSASNERPKLKDLGERLKEEAPGILAWLVRGCIEWQRQGLNPPREVLAARNEYRAKEDDVGNFVEACCITEDLPDGHEELFKDVYEAYTQWYEATIGDKKFCLNKKRWGAIMGKRFKKYAHSGKTWLSGFALKPAHERETGGSDD